MSKAIECGNGCKAPLSFQAGYGWTCTGCNVKAADDGATLMYPEDRHPYTVVSVTKSGNYLMATRDKATRTDDNGMSQSQEYTYTADPEAKPERFNRQGDGTYATRNGVTLALGYRRRYHCYER